MAYASTTKSVIVTGASRGIGRAVAARLAHDGFAVVVNFAGNSTKAEEVVAEIKGASGQAIAVHEGFTQYVTKYDSANLYVAEYATTKACTTANNQMTGGFVGMIFAFFTTLFGASLVVPSVLMKIIKKVKNRYLKSPVMARHLTLAAFIL